MVIVIQAETPHGEYSRQVVAVVEYPESHPTFFQTLYQTWRAANEEAELEEFVDYLEARGYKPVPFISSTVHYEESHEPGT